MAAAPLSGRGSNVRRRESRRVRTAGRHAMAGRISPRGVALVPGRETDGRAVRALLALGDAVVVGVAARPFTGIATGRTMGGRAPGCRSVDMPRATALHSAAWI